jgi:enamine deaminase RidA (YjgF/YER057c/UK114 family)
MLNKALAGLKEVGCDFLSVARTWMWLGDILSWYGEFNHERNEFFSENGLLSRTEQPRFPASTGIGVKPAGRAGCAMDLVAVGGAPESITRLLKGGDQNSAFNYGSAFSRAATAVMPAGKTVFVSGTAAVACDGSTQHVGNAPAQIEATVAHFRAILGQTGCSDGDVVQAIVYCKSDEVARAFRAAFCHLPYPQILVICDICRDDLLFEIEGTACPGAKTV